MASRSRMIFAGVAIVSVALLVTVWIGARRQQSASSQAARSAMETRQR